MNIHDVILFVQVLAPGIIGLTMIVEPSIVMTIFGEQAHFEDSMRPIARDLWRVLGAVLVGASTFVFGISRLDRITRRGLLPYLMAGVAVVAIVNCAIQLQGRWNNLRIGIVLLELFFVVMHVIEYMWLIKADNRMKKK